MAGDNNIEKNVNASKNLENKFDPTHEIFEEELTNDSSNKLYNLLFNSKSDPKRKKFIREALKKFPHPEQSTDIDIDL